MRQLFHLHPVGQLVVPARIGGPALLLGDLPDDETDQEVVLQVRETASNRCDDDRPPAAGLGECPSESRSFVDFLLVLILDLAIPRCRENVTAFIRRDRFAWPMLTLFFCSPLALIVLFTRFYRDAYKGRTEKGD